MQNETATYYFSILRNGTEITPFEYSFITHISTHENYFDGNMKTATISFGISNENPTISQQEDYFDLMKTYIFSSMDTYKISIGRNKANASNNTFDCIVMMVSPTFPDGGNIGFSVNLQNGLSVNPNTAADEMNPNGYAPGVSVYHVVEDQMAQAGLKLICNDKDRALLSSLTYANGISRPVSQNTNAFLQELQNDYGFYLDPSVAGQLTVKRVDVTQNPSLYFIYRPTAKQLQMDPDSYGLLLSFDPDLSKPPINISVGVGANTDTGDPVAQASVSNSKDPVANLITIKDVAAQNLSANNTPRGGSVAQGVFGTGTTPPQSVTDILNGNAQQNVTGSQSVIPEPNKTNPLTLGNTPATVPSIITPNATNK